MFSQLLSQFYKIPKLFIAAIMANPIGMFVYSILAKWYLIIMVAAVVVAFWVLKGLQSAGVLDAWQKTVVGALSDAKAIAQYCTPLITDLKATMDCIGRPHDYTPNQDEQDLQNNVDQMLQMLPGNNSSSTNSGATPANPYE